VNLGTGVIYSSPQFVDPENGDFSLQANSPAIDAGHPDLDGDGTSWESDTDDQDPDGTRMDMGIKYRDKSIDGLAPSTPAGLVATPGNQKVILTWQANSEDDLNTYKIYGDTIANPSALISTISAGTETYIHTGIANGLTYYYKITAVDTANNESNKSSVVNSLVHSNQTQYSLNLSASNYIELKSSFGFSTSKLSFMVWVKSDWDRDDENIFDLADHDANQNNNNYVYQLRSDKKRLKLYVGGVSADYGTNIR
jgi:hypothetical protein